MLHEYQKRVAALREKLERGERIFRQVGNLRLAIAAVGAVIAWLHPWWLPAPVIALVAAMVYHDSIARSIERGKRAVGFYERGLARVEGRWMDLSGTGEHLGNPEHPYAGDLDLFGRGSLFQLISLARTAAGERTLADYFLHRAARPMVSARQDAVQELTPRLDLREDLALLGDDVRAGIHPEALEKWGTAPPVGFPKGLRIPIFLSAVVMVLAGLGLFFHVWTARPLLLWIIMQGAIGVWLRDRVLSVLGAVELPEHDLGLLSVLVERLERESFRSERLIAIRCDLSSEGALASKEIGQLRKLIDRNEWSHNQFFAPAARLLLWSTQFAMAIEAWRMRSGPAIGRWIHAVGEMEALCSLAGYAAEHPADVYPEFVAGRRFEAVGLAHPLLPESKAVANDVRLAGGFSSGVDGAVQLLIISGSNMSGKSTLLRAVGVNAVLAWAGAPVRAQRLAISELSIGASIRVQDSLQDGKSRFHAEITRLSQVCKIAEAGEPLLFLLDELLSGTNSHDRRIGAEALLRNLVERDAIGLATTHDLALARIVEELNGRAANVHFEDHIEDGRIAFDFRMREGVVRKSNALALMRSVGLRV